jgi:hypothetical protein
MLRAMFRSVSGSDTGQTEHIVDDTVTEDLEAMPLYLVATLRSAIQLTVTQDPESQVWRAKIYSCQTKTQVSTSHRVCGALCGGEEAWWSGV